MRLRGAHPPVLAAERIFKVNIFKSVVQNDDIFVLTSFCECECKLRGSQLERERTTRTRVISYPMALAGFVNFHRGGGVIKFVGAPRLAVASSEANVF